MISGPKYKICRRLGPGVYEKCQTQKFVMSQARHSAGKGMKRPKQLSDYGLQLIEKQRIRFTYGLTEKQFANYVKEASTLKGTSAAQALREMLELRLDNAIYRMGLANTRSLARQMASHGHFLVNGSRTKIPSYRIRPGDIISVREGSRSSALFKELDKRLKNYSTPNWLVFDPAKMEGTVKGRPDGSDGFLNFNSVLEFYSR